jgi:hypothetical protein
MILRFVWKCQVIGLRAEMIGPKVEPFMSMPCRCKILEMTVLRRVPGDQVERGAETIPRICEHLGNGANISFSIDAMSLYRRLNRLSGRWSIWTKLSPILRSWLAIFDPEDGLDVTLEPAEAAELGSERLTSIDLASRVLIYWGKRMGYADIGPTPP